jgi:dihydrofolate reductase
MLMSLDGLVERPDGALDWVTADEELHEVSAAELNAADAILYGRRTFEIMVDYWPTAVADNPGLSPGEVAFAEAVNNPRLKRVVYSRTLEAVGWNAELRREVDADEIRQMKAQPGRDIALASGGDLAATFMRLGLVDEYRLLVQPVVIGEGKALFRNVQDTHKLKLVSTTALKSGVVGLVYQPA